MGCTSSNAQQPTTLRAQPQTMTQSQMNHLTLDCPVCEQPFNQTSRLPVNLQCGDTVCIKCSAGMNKDTQNGTFECSLCKKSLRCETETVANKYVVEMIKKTQLINIYCDEHPENQAEYYCRDHKTLICSNCGIKTHSDHKQNFVALKREDLDKFNMNIHEKLTIESIRICSLLQDISSYQKDEKKLTSKQYILMIKEAQQTLARRMKTQEEKKSLSFLAGDIQNIPVNIPAQIIKPAVIIEPEVNNQAISKDLNEKQDAINKGVFGTLISEADMPLIKSWIGNQKIRLELIYRASVDGFTAQKFHEKCNNKGPTISFIQSDLDKVFGGYASIPWKSSAPQFVKDHNAFIFSLTHKTQHIQYQNKHTAVYQYSAHLQGFGSAGDIYIADNCNENTTSSSNIGFVYKPPEGIAYGTEQAKSYLAGQYEFKVIENEVYKVINI